VTTKWRKEYQKSKVLISGTIKKASESVGDDLLAVSDQAINFVVLETFSEPENAAQIEKLEEPKQSKVIGFSDIFLITRIFCTDSTRVWNKIKRFGLFM